MLKLVGHTGIHIPELSFSLVIARGEAVDESEVHMTEDPESFTPLPTKKGKSLRAKGSSKSSRKTIVDSASSSTAPIEGATAGTSSPAGRIEALKAAKRTLTNSARATTPEPQDTIEQAITEISAILSPIPEGVPARKSKGRVAHANIQVFGEFKKMHNCVILTLIAK